MNDGNLMIVTGLDAPAILSALYDATSPVGLGKLHARGPLTREEAIDLCRDSGSPHGVVLDYLFGRPLKVTIFTVGTNTPEADFASLTDFKAAQSTCHIRGAWLFDRDAGTGAAERAITAAGGVIRR